MDPSVGSGKFIHIVNHFAQLIADDSGFSIEVEGTEAADPAFCKGVITVRPDVATQLIMALHGSAALGLRVVVTPITDNTEEEKEMANLYRVPDSNGERHIVAADSEAHALELVGTYCEKVGAGKVGNDTRVQYLGAADLVSSGAVLSGEDDNAEKKSGQSTPRK